MDNAELTAKPALGHAKNISQKLECDAPLHLRELMTVSKMYVGGGLVVGIGGSCHAVTLCVVSSSQTH